MFQCVHLSGIVGGEELTWRDSAMTCFVTSRLSSASSSAPVKPPPLGS